jgi:FkbM family methyltransferase
MRKYYYFSLFKTRAFKMKPLVTLFRAISLIIIDLFKINKIVNIKHLNINFNFFYLPALSKKSGGRGIYLYREKIEDLMEFGHKFIHKNDHCVDGGANQGIYTLSFASAVGPEGKVISVEPFDYCINNIKTNIELNKFKNIYIEQKVLYDQPKLQKKLDYSLGVGAASIVRDFGLKKYLKVETTTIDEIAIRHKLKPNFIKLDIEGAEYDALLGSIQTLKNSDPAICLECTDKKNFYQIKDFLNQYNYSPYYFNQSNLDKLTQFQPLGNIFFFK